MTSRMQQRRDTAANWTTNNPTLAAGELGFESDSGLFKIGTGSTAWTSLNYAGGASGYTTTATAAGTTTLTATSNPNQFFTGSTTQTVVLPVVSTLGVGKQYFIYNNSSGSVTVQSSGANNIIVLPAGTASIFTCIATTGTTAASWSVFIDGFASGPAGMAALMGYTSTVTAAGTTTLTASSTYYQQFTGSTTQTVVLPVTSTLTTGWTYHIVNNSTGLVTVNSSGGNQVIVVPVQTTAMVTCIGTTQTTAADWESGITDFSTVVGSGSAVMVSGAGTAGQVLSSTGSGTQWSTPAGGAAFSEFMLIGC